MNPGRNIVRPLPLPTFGKVLEAGQRPGGVEFVFGPRGDEVVVLVVGHEVGRWSRRDQVIHGVIVDWRLP